MVGVEHLYGSCVPARSNDARDRISSPGIVDCK
jgi:hypothetical protein